MKKYLLFLSSILISFSSYSQDFEWAKGFLGVSGTLSESHAIAVDAAGNVYTTGYFEGDVDFDPSSDIYTLSANQKHSFISKLDVNGNFIWAKQISGNGPPVSWDSEAMDITLDDSANIYITGYFKGTVDFDPSNGTIHNLTSHSDTIGLQVYYGNDHFILKLDADANFIWAKGIAGFGYVTYNSNSVDVDSTGNVYMAGVFTDSVDFDPDLSSSYFLSGDSMSNIFILKLNALGNFVWVKSISTGDALSSPTYKTVSVAVDDVGNVFTSSGFSFGSSIDFNPGTGIDTLTPTGYSDVFVLKLDATGNFVWVKQLGGNYPTAIFVDDLGNVYTAGLFHFMVDFDPGVGVQNLTSAGDGDIFISKLDNDGNYIWAKDIGGPEQEEVMSIALDANGNVYTTGYFCCSSVDFDPGTLIYNLTPIGPQGFIEDNFFISKLDANGNFIWAKSMGDTTENRVRGIGIAVDGSENVFTTGSFLGATVDFDPGAGTYFLNSPYIFVHKLGNTTGIENVHQENKLSIYPNPTKDILTIEILNGTKPKSILITDITGRVVREINQTKPTLQLNISDYASGVYLVKIIADNGNTITKKFVKQ